MRHTLVGWRRENLRVSAHCCSRERPNEHTTSLSVQVEHTHVQRIYGPEQDSVHGRADGAVGRSAVCQTLRRLSPSTFTPPFAKAWAKALFRCDVPWPRTFVCTSVLVNLYRPVSCEHPYCCCLRGDTGVSSEIKNRVPRESPASFLADFPFIHRNPSPTPITRSLSTTGDARTATFATVSCVCARGDLTLPRSCRISMRTTRCTVRCAGW